MADTIPLKAFFEEVERRLSTCSADQLRSILRAMARDVPPGRRREFADRLRPDPGVVDEIRHALRQDDLLADIDDLAAEIRSAMDDADRWEGRYGEGWDDEDSLGRYEEFVGRLAGLFDRAEGVFDVGDMPLAREAYRRLFEILTIEDDYGRGVRGDNLTETDLAAARGREFRARYETEPPGDRPRRLLEAFRERDGYEWPGPAMLEDLIRPTSRPLPDRGPFLRAWIALLRQETDARADRWLREAIRLSEGIKGLAALAREEGKKRPRAYLDWVAALREDGKARQAIAAAREALRALPKDLPIRAAIADHLAALVQESGDTETLREVRWLAFAARPVLGRLLDLWEATPPAHRTRAMRRAARHLEAALGRDRRRSTPSVDPDDDGPSDRPTDALDQPAWVTTSLLAHARMLGKDWEAARSMATKGPVLGWSSPENPQGVVVPAGLVLLSGGPGSLPTNLAHLWEETLARTAIDFYLDQKPEDGERLAAAYREAMAATRLGAESAEALLRWCVDVAERRASAIVENTRRRSYDKAAGLAAAGAEVLRDRGEPGRAEGLLGRLRERFPRHRAFQDELRAAEARMRSSRPAGRRP